MLKEDLTNVGLKVLGPLSYLFIELVPHRVDSVPPFVVSLGCAELLLFQFTDASDFVLARLTVAVEGFNRLIVIAAHGIDAVIRRLHDVRFVLGEQEVGSADG